MRYAARRLLVGTAAAGTVALIAASAGATAWSVMAAAVHAPVAAVMRVQPVNVPSLARITRVPPQRAALRPAAQVPVLAYHALDDRCAAAAATCRASTDYESVSAAQFTAEMKWLYGHGYHTVTMTQYLAWLARPGTLLPPDPVLIVDDNGDSDFLLGAEPVLYHYRFTVTAVIVTGFADAATTGYCRPFVVDAGQIYDVQVNCGGPNTWNATWPQLRALSPQVYGYALEAGADGHFVQDYSKTCTAYYACVMPGEIAAAYEARVTRDIRAGAAELARQLPAGRVSTVAWTAPYSDLGYTCKDNECPDEISTGPAGWLAGWAASHFSAVFVQTASRNGTQNERFRYEVHNTTTLKQFRQAIGVYLRTGSWSRT